MFGHKMRGPDAGSDAAAREQAILDEEGISPADFRRLGKLAPGTRRPLAIAIEDVTVEALGKGAIRIGLALPSGAYATSVLREIMKSEPPSEADRAAAERTDPDDASGDDPDDDPEPANTGAAGADTR
jgi:tRNA pseudouridine13 synthase